MAVKESGKRDLDIQLQGVELSTSAFGNGACKRVVTAELVYPRMMTASKSATKLLAFAKGKTDLTDKPWFRRILFKESVEHTF